MFNPRGASEAMRVIGIRPNQSSPYEGVAGGLPIRFDRFQIVLLACYAALALITFSVGYSNPRTNDITSGVIITAGILLALVYTVQTASLTRGKRATYLIWRSVCFACLIAALATGTDVIVRLQSETITAPASSASTPFWGLIYVWFGLLVAVFLRHPEELGLRVRSWMIALVGGLLAVALPLVTLFATLPFLRQESLALSVRLPGAIFINLDTLALALILFMGIALKPGRETWPWKLLFASTGVLALTSLVTETLRGRTDASYWGATSILFALAIVLLCLSALAQSSESWREGEQSRKRSRWLAALNRLGLTVNHLMDRKAVAETAVDFFSTFGAVKSVAFHSIDYTDGCLRLEASRGVEPKLLPAIGTIEMTEKMHGLIQAYAADARTLDFYADPIYVDSLEGSMKIMPEVEISPWEMVKDLRSIMAFFAVLGASGYVRVPVQTPDLLLGFVFLSGLDRAEFDDDVKEMMGSAGRIISLAMNNALLYEDLAKRHAELKATYEELEKADRYKDDIISVTSHELRQPLTLLAGYSDVLLSRDERITPEKKEHALGAIIKATLRMKKIAEDFTDVVAIRTGSLVPDIDSYSPRQLVQEVYERLPEDVRERVKIDEGNTQDTIYIDFDKTARAVGNLVENSLKFDENGGPVEVSLGNGRGQLRIVVRDHGPGIPTEQREAVFDRFYQLDDSMHHHHEGMGMGLFIARNVVEAQGGRLFLRSTAGGGCTFVISIPQPAQGGNAAKAENH